MGKYQYTRLSLLVCQLETYALGHLLNIVIIRSVEVN